MARQHGLTPGPEQKLAGKPPSVSARERVRARLVDAAVTAVLTISISATLLIAWLWALAMWYPASSPPDDDPNHGCGPTVACLET